MSEPYFIEHSRRGTDFNDIVEQTFAYFRRDGKNFGIIGLGEYRGILVQYNLDTGRIKIVSEEMPSINTFYRSKAFPHITFPILEAIALLAKVELLLALTQLNDEGIIKIYQKNHQDNKSKELINLQRNKVSKTLLQIQNIHTLSLRRLFFYKVTQKTLTQKVVADTLKKTGIDTIRAKNHVVMVMSLIQNHLNTCGAAYYSPKSGPINL